MENKNLQKITDVCRKFNECFGDTLEGRGYLTVLDMLERAGLTNEAQKLPKPQTLRELFDTLVAILKAANIRDVYTHIEVNVYSDEIKYSAYVSDLGSVKGTSVKTFLTNLEELIEEKGEEFRKKQQEKEEKTHNDDATLK